MEGMVRRFALFGNPVAHSVSPLMMTYAFDQMGIRGHYRAVAVSRAQDIVGCIRSMGIEGASVTIPHKVAVMNFLDELSEDARAIGAVNTVIESDGKLRGDNTDWLGVERALAEVMTIAGRRYAVLGAGGAARAVIYCIKKNGGAPLLLNRTVPRGKEVARDMNCEFVPLADVRTVDADCLINTTPVGMWPNVGQSPVAQSVLERFAWVMDTIYNPLETTLMKDAVKTGCTALSGLAMFVHQGGQQLRLWTGKEPPVEAMMRVVRDHLTHERN